VREGDHVRAADGFVAIRDIAPKAETHLLVLPERHVESFREICEFPPDEAKRMLGFVAETAREAGLTDYRVVVNVGQGAGQTVFHLHWHVLGGRVSGMPT
jgi:histidine triad (HIT) family protein